MEKNVLFLLLALLTMWSCNNEEFVKEGGDITSRSTTAFVHLSGTAAQTAGVVRIVADAPEAELIWITTPDCNLDTTQTVVTLENGIGELSVKWLEKQKNGQYAPEATAFKAWLRIKAGDYLTDVPLILSEHVDSVGIMQAAQTRGISENRPRVSSLRFNPDVVVMQTAIGGAGAILLNEISSVELNYGQITDETRINKTDLIATANKSEILDFKWVDDLAPTTGFLAEVTANAPLENLWASCTLRYDPTGGGGDVDTVLLYQSNTMPTTGNLPITSNIYTFNFTGTYEGPIQLRSLANGIVLYTATAYQFPANQPRTRVLENAGTARPITFQYKRDGRDWTNLPVSTNKTQDGIGGGIPGNITASEILPSGNIPEDGGMYYCRFTGGPGNVIFRALKKGVSVYTSAESTVTPTAPADILLNIPGLDNEMNTTIEFEYSTDHGTSWIPITTRNQVNWSLSVNIYGPIPTVAARNGSVTFNIHGTYPKPIRVWALNNGKIVGDATAPFAQDLVVPIENNTTGASRGLDFYWSIEEKGKVIQTFFGRLTQSAN